MRTGKRRSASAIKNPELAAMDLFRFRSQSENHKLLRESTSLRSPQPNPPNETAIPAHRERRSASVIIGDTLGRQLPFRRRALLKAIRWTMRWATEERSDGKTGWQGGNRNGGLRAASDGHMRSGSPGWGPSSRSPTSTCTRMRNSRPNPRI